MLKGTIFRIFPPAPAFTLLSFLAINGAEAQDPPLRPRQTPQQKDSMDKNSPPRQRTQTDDRAPTGRDHIKIPTDLVRLDVTVVDQNNNPVSDLKKEDFIVYEDNVKQKIDHVSREEAPVSFGMVID